MTFDTAIQFVNGYQLSYGSGIDAGGIYADTVLDYVSGKMISSGKTLTTRTDPSEGIRNAPVEIKFLDKPAGL